MGLPSEDRFCRLLNQFENGTNAYSRGERFFKMLSYVINGPLTATLVCGGVGLNLLCIVLLRRTRSAIARYLVALAVWNTLLLLFAFLLYCLPTLLYGRLPVSGPYVYVYNPAFASSNVAFVGSVWVLIALNVDRYIALIRPLYHHTRLRHRTTQIILIVSAMAILTGFPRMSELTIHYCRTSEDDEAPMIVRSNIGNSPLYNLIYRVIGQLLLHALVPYMILLVLSVRVLLRVRHRAITGWAAAEQRAAAQELLSGQQRRGEDPGLRRHQFRSDYLLVVLIFKFLCTNVGPVVINIAELLSLPVANVYVDLSNLLVVLNSASNFFVYVVWNRNFRAAFRQLMMHGGQAVEEGNDVRRSMMVTFRASDDGHGNIQSSVGNPADPLQRSHTNSRAHKTSVVLVQQRLA